MSLQQRGAAVRRVAGGNHLAAQNDEPEKVGFFTEAELLAADRAGNLGKAARLAERNDVDALALQVHMLRCAGGL